MPTSVSCLMLRLMLVCMAGGQDWYVVVRRRTETMQRMNKRDTRRKGNRIREAKPVASAYRNGRGMQAQEAREGARVVIAVTDAQPGW